MRNFVDLHMHSRYSDDGEFSPAQLVQMCDTQGIQVMAISDHNSVRGVAQAQSAALAAGITCIAATEIDCTYEGVNLHVLGYGMDYAAADFAQIEQAILTQSVAASRHMLEATQKLGFAVTQQQMEHAAQGQELPEVWTGELFAEVLLADARYTAHPLLSPYRAGGARSDNPFVNFYWDYYAQGTPCYVPILYPSLGEVVQTIHNHGGKAVLAHPGVNLKDKIPLFAPIMDVGLDGVEVFSSYHTPEQVQWFLQQARDRDCIITCGSDFHGKTKPAVQLGVHGCTLTERELSEQVQRLLQ